MIIVSGEPRSGTSLTMEICRLLGAKIYGSEQPRRITDEQQRENLLHLNEKFWEIPYIVMRGIRLNQMRQHMSTLKGEARQTVKDRIKEIYSHSESAVKIIWNGLLQTDDEILEDSKILLCTRHPHHILTSQQDLDTGLRVVGKYKDATTFVKPKVPTTPHRYLNNLYNFCRWRLRPKNFKLDLLLVDYDETIDNARQQVTRIAKFLEIKNPNIDEAASCISNNRRRSNQSAYEEDIWLVAEEAYQLLMLGELDAVISRLEDYQRQERENPENTVWLDEDTFFPIKADLYRSMLNKPKLVKQMRETRSKRERAGALCTSCPLYNRNGDPYIVVTPYDLPNITRNLVDCEQEGQVTLEQCQQHWGQVRDNKVWRQRRGLPIA